MITTNPILLTFLIKNCDGKSIDFIPNRSDIQPTVFAPISLGVHRYARTEENVRLDMRKGSSAILSSLDSDIDSGYYGMC